MAELESMKYFTPEMLGEKPEEQQNPYASTPDTGNSDPGRLATAAELGLAEWSIGLTIMVWMFSIFGGWAILGSIISMIKIATLESSLAYYQKLDSVADMRYYVAFTEFQIKNCMWLYLVQFVRLGLGVAFLAAATLLKQKKEDANRFAAMVCIAGVFYGLVSMLVGWIMLPDPTLIVGVPTEIVEGLNLIAVAFLVAGFFINMIFYGGIMAYLLNKNNRRLFGRRVPATDLDGPVEAGQMA